jgi:hypothetical protein
MGGISKPLRDQKYQLEGKSDVLSVCICVHMCNAIIVVLIITSNDNIVIST